MHDCNKAVIEGNKIGCNKIGCNGQGRLTVNYRYTHRKFQLKFSALLKDYDLKYAENSKKNLT